MQFDILKFSHIGRMVDPRYPTNLAIMLWSFLGAVAFFALRLVEGQDITQSAFSALYFAIAVFLTWVLAREIDPEEALSAFIPTFFVSVILFVFMPDINVLAITFVLPLIRIINRTVGLPAKLSDSLFILLFTAFIAFASSWIYALPAVLAFLFDGYLPVPDRKHNLFAIASMVVVAAAFTSQRGTLDITLPTIEGFIAIGIGTIATIFLMMRSRQLTVVSDCCEEPLMPIRVQAGQFFVLLFGYYLAIWKGNAGLIEFLPVWLVLIGVAIFPLIKPLLPTRLK